MSSVLILDKSDPGVAEMVAAWKDGQSYKAEVEFTQDSSSPNSTNNTVTAIVNLSEEDTDTEEEAPAPKRKMPKGEMVPKEGMMSYE